MAAGLAAGLVGCSGAEDGAAPDPGPVPDVEAAAPTVPRLTTAQYRNAIADVFGSDVVVPTGLEPDLASEGLLALGAARSTISSRGVEQYEKAAFDIAGQVTASERRDRLPCVPQSATDSDCARTVLAAFGRRLWRRPLTDDELAIAVRLFSEAAQTLGDFHQGLEFGLAMLLQSPNFLFRTELGEPDPDRAGQFRFTDYEMASRLSFFLWNTTPDDDLLDAAEAGELTREATLRSHVRRLLESDRARVGVRNLFTDVYQFYRLDSLSKDPTLFTHMSPDVGPAAREETLRLIEHLVFDRQADYRELLTTRQTFINRKLASIYSVRAPAREGFAELVWPDDSGRAGILSHLSILALYSHPVASSATLRGKFVRTQIMCDQIPPPPAGVDTSLPEPSTDAPTLRERVGQHLTDEVCAGCHLLMDPIGLSLENFDALGQYRATENGAPIDPSGEVDGVPFANAVELGRVLADNPKVGRCLVRNLYRIANGRFETGGEGELIEYIDRAFAARGYRVLDAVEALVMSPGFRFTAAPELANQEGQ